MGRWWNRGAGPRAAGSKPTPGYQTYGLLGEAAALIHRAADDIAPSAARENYDAAVLIDDQLQRMHRLLVQAGRWRQAGALGERLKRRARRDCPREGNLSHGPHPRQCALGGGSDRVRLRQCGNVLACCGTWGVLRSSRGLLRGLAGRISNSAPIQCSGRGSRGGVRNRRRNPRAAPRCSASEICLRLLTAGLTGKPII
jgi:hypothetical protein